MHRIAEDVLFWSIGSAVGAVMGFVFWLVMTWAEWRKMGGNAQLGLHEFIEQDLSSILIAGVSTVVLYFAIPSLGAWQWLVAVLGFTPTLNYLTAFMISYCGSSIAMKLRNISRRISE